MINVLRVGCQLQVNKRISRPLFLESHVAIVSIHEMLNKKKRTAERQKQIVLAKQRGEAHIGLAARKTAAHRKALKKVRPD